MELVALADTIKVLNDDDALELFKKTLPGASSFVQVKVTASALRQHAMTALKAIHSRGQKRDPRVDLIELAMRGGKIGFGKIIKMIDELVADLKKEQAVDEERRAIARQSLTNRRTRRKA